MEDDNPLETALDAVSNLTLGEVKMNNEAWYRNQMSYQNVVKEVCEKFDLIPASQLTALEERIKRLESVLVRVRLYILNGIECGYIQTPDKDDPANDTLPLINKVLEETL